jgi:hypothetical protein
MLWEAKMPREQAEGFTVCCLGLVSHVDVPCYPLQLPITLTPACVYYYRLYPI